MAPRRLPAWTQPQVPEDSSTSPASHRGCPSRLRTDATTIDLTLHATRVGLPGSGLCPRGSICSRTASGPTAKPSWAATFYGSHRPTRPRTVPGAAETIRLAGASSVGQGGSIWLPQSAICDLIPRPTVRKARRPGSESALGALRLVHQPLHRSRRSDGTWPRSRRLRPT